MLTSGVIRIHPPTLKAHGGPPPPSTYMDVARATDARYCFMRRLHEYMQTCDELGCPLRAPMGHIFRPTASDRVSFREESLTTAACRSRLKSALASADADEGETTHSFRRGASQDARANGEDPALTMERMHVVTPAIYRRYTDQACPTRFRPQPGAEAEEPDVKPEAADPDPAKGSGRESPLASRCVVQ